MNKDLAGVSAVWRALQGGGVAASNCLSSTLPSTYRLLFKEPPKMVLRRMNGSVSGDGRSFRCCTVGELLRDRDCVSAIAVTLVCDEKRAGVESQERRWDFSTQSPRTFFITVLTP